MPHAPSSRSWRNLRQLVDASRDASIVLTSRGRVLFANSAAQKMFLGKPPGADVLRTAKEAAEKPDFVIFADADGRTRQFERSARRVIWDDAPVWLITLHDITSVRETEGHLMRVNHLYAALTQTDAAIARATDAGELLDEVCRIAVAFGGFRLAWVARPNREQTEIERVAAAGPAATYLDELHVGLDPNTPEGQGPIARTLRIGVPYVCDDFAHDDLTKPWHTVAARHDIASFAVCPIRVSGAVSAVFGVYASEPGFFRSDLVALVTQMAAEISGALDRLATREARARAERALAESEARFRQMAAATRQVFWLRDAATSALLYVSPAFETVFGYPADAAIAGRVHLTELIHPDDWARVSDAWQAAHEGIGHALQYRIVRPDGSLRWIEDEIRAILEGDRVARISGCATDITERHDAEEQLRLFRNLVDYSKDGFHIIKPAENFRLVFINEAGVRHFGLSREKLTTLSVWDWDPEATPEKCLEMLAVIRREGSMVFETAHRRADGSSVPVEVSANLLSHGGEEFIAGYFRDITARVSAESAMRENEERLREQAMLIDAANDAIILRALDQTIQFWNRGAERILGWTRDEALGRKTTELHHREMRTLDEIMRIILEKGAWNGESTCVTKAGNVVVMESRWTLIRDSAGQANAVLGINTDVTERRRMEAVSLRAQRLESIGTLAAGIAHDLNNILAPIVLSSDMLRPMLAETRGAELVDAISTSARRGAEVVRQILSFGRGAQSTRVPVNLRHVLPEIRSIVRETFPRTITCTITTATDLANIRADPTQLHQALLNLCLNARDAMPAGGVIRIEVANADVDPTYAALVTGARAGRHVRVRVIDTGSGIPEGIRERIFDPFFTTKGVGKGAGLGLSTTLAIVRGHGGFITVDTEVQRGSTFALHFPAEERESAAASAQTTATALPPGRGELILVIDDEESVRSITRQSLEGAGYRVLTAADGAESLMLFVQRRVDIALVLTDLLMPVMGGIAAIKAVRTIDPGVRVIAMSGAQDNTPVDTSHAGTNGIGFLLKPFTLETLLATVRTALDAPRHQP